MRPIRQVSIICALMNEETEASERFSDVRKLTQLIRRKWGAQIRFSNFGSKPNSSVWKTRPFVIGPCLLCYLSHAPDRHPVLQTFLCLFAAAVSLPEVSFGSRCTFLPDSSHVSYLPCISPGRVGRFSITPNTLGAPDACHLALTQ